QHSSLIVAAIVFMSFYESAAVRQNRLASAVPMDLRQAVLNFSKSRVLTGQYFEEHEAQPRAPGTGEGCQERILGL
ncbi:MAG: hypothetical protein WB918_03260, partial [Candidatus Sulfotelmatobacter sp.]